MVVKCKYCLVDFEAQRSTATFCSDTHRTLFGKLSDEEKLQKQKELESIKNPSIPLQPKIEIQKTKMVVTKKGTLELKPSDEKIKALNLAVEKINKDFGKGSVMLMGEKVYADVKAISTGSLSIDIALGVGGFPKGAIIEIYGWESSGKTTIALHAIAEAQKQGGKCAFIDVEHALDKVYAKSIGVNVEDLFISQPDYGEQALEIADRLIVSGGFALIVVDSVAALVPKAELEGEMGDNKMGLHARLMSQACRKMTASVSKSNTILLFINQLRMKIGVFPGVNPEVVPGGNALKFYSTIRLDVRKLGALKDGDEIYGNRVKVKVIKSKVAPPLKVAEFDIIFGEGINKMGEIVDIAVELDIIKKSGSWYSYMEDKLGQGRDAVITLFKDNPEMAQEIENKINETILK